MNKYLEFFMWVLAGWFIGWMLGLVGVGILALVIWLVYFNNNERRNRTK